MDIVFIAARHWDAWCDYSYMPYNNLSGSLTWVSNYIPVLCVCNFLTMPWTELWFSLTLITGTDPNYIGGLAILADFLFSVNNILVGLWLNCISSVEITLFLLADILRHRALFQCYVIADSSCKLIQGLFLQWFVNLMGAHTFLVFFFNSFFLEVNCGLCYLCEGR